MNELDECRRVWVCKRCGNCLDHCKHKDESNFHEDLAMPCSVRLPHETQATNEPQDIVVEARELAPYVQGVADSNSGGRLSRVPELLRQLCDEVERLRKVADVPPNERSVCDCHTWPTVSELHDYTVALEQRARHIEACKDCQACWEGSQP